MTLNKTEQNYGVCISALAILLLMAYVSFSMIDLENATMMLSTLGILVFFIFCLCFFILRSLRKQNKAAEINYLNIGTQRYILGLFMIFYGIPKLFGTFFDYQLFALDSKLINVSEFELAWYYFGKNRYQELFAGVMEFLPGILLLNKRTYYVAALILLPVTAQVFILNFFFKIGGVTLPAATILLLCNCYIIYSQKEKIFQFFKSLDFSTNIHLSSKAQKIIKLCRVVIIGFAVLLLVKNLKPVFFKSIDEGKYQKLVGVYRLEKVMKNNVIYLPEKDSTVYKDLYIEKQSRWNILRRCNDKTDAFVMNIGAKNDSIAIYINKGGIGDDNDIIDSLSVLKGTYSLNGNDLLIKGIQLGDTLTLKYKRQVDLQPKKWFW